MSFKDSPQPYANLCILDKNTSSFMAQTINNFFIICSIMNAFIYFLNVTNVLLQSSKLELLHKLFFKTPWVVACYKSMAFIPKLLVPMSFVSNALSPQCCKPFSRLSFIYNPILSFLYTFIFSFYNYFGVC
jgi:hypothetical protein